MQIWLDKFSCSILSWVNCLCFEHLYCIKFYDKFSFNQKSALFFLLQNNQFYFYISTLEMKKRRRKHPQLRHRWPAQRGSMMQTISSCVMKQWKKLQLLDVGIRGGLRKNESNCVFSFKDKNLKALIDNALNQL
jgi:hypothetical protein